MSPICVLQMMGLLGKQSPSGVETTAEVPLGGGDYSGSCSSEAHTEVSQHTPLLVHAASRMWVQCEQLPHDPATGPSPW